MKLDKRDQRTLALWAANCAERVLPYFEAEHPEDDRPHKAIEVCRAWGRGKIQFSMSLVREASLSAHAAARAADNPSARAAARAAGQAVGTSHVPEHACGAAAYAAAAVAYAVDPATARIAHSRERAWQMRRIPKSLRKKGGIMKKVMERIGLIERRRFG